MAENLPPPQPDARTLLMASLLQLEADMRRTTSARELAFTTVNSSWNIIPYRQMIFWWPDAFLRPALVAVSGLAQVTDDSPYCLWVRRLLVSLKSSRDIEQPVQLTVAEVAEEFQTEWSEWLAAHLLSLPLKTPTGRHLGGLLLTRETAFSAEEIELLQRLADTCAHALWAFRPTMHDWHIWRSHLFGDIRRQRLIGIALALILFIPVHQSALAPAQIIGDPAQLVAAPQEGMIKNFAVLPNQPVKKGQLLFTLDDTALSNKRDVAEKDLEVVRTDYLRAAQKAFSDEKSRSEMAELQAKVAEKTAELNYLTDMLKRTQVVAPADGIAVFGDVNDWIGKPVQAGERVLLLANPHQVAVQMELPVDDAINLSPGAEVKVYLNITPLHSLDARLTQTSYEAEPTTDGFMAYPLRARLDAGQAVPRIGLKGTAKIYGSRVPLIYYIFRRPLAFIRHKLGW